VLVIADALLKILGSAEAEVRQTYKGRLDRYLTPSVCDSHGRYLSR